MNNTLRVGVAGVGIGAQHIDAYRELPEQFEVAALCDIDAYKVRDMADHYQIPQVLTDFSALCQRDDLDLIDISTPSYLHASQTLEALQAGKHVICEKPAAGSLQEIDQLLAAESRSGKRVMPIFQYRFGHGVQKLKYLIEQGLAGPAYLTTVETAWRRRPAYYAVPWRGKWATELGGALVTLAIHAHDILYYVLGPTKSVFARTATKVNPIETEDCVCASLEMADGSLASLAVTTGSAFEITRHRFCFQGFTAESNYEAYRNTCDPWSFIGDTPEITERINDTLARFTQQPEKFVRQFALFYEALQHDAELPVTLADARASLELITAIYCSAQTGQVVTLPITPDHPNYASWRP